MLEEIHVKDLALIEEAWLEFGPGMTVLTGETGAGKTALLGALKLLLGERADSGAVRTGAVEALVEGRFCTEGGEVLAKRRVGADGRSRCVLDGEMSTVGAMASRLGPLVDLHGQHEHQALLSASTHVHYLDGWAGESVSNARDEYVSARAAFRAAAERRDELIAAVEEALRDADRLRFMVDEIDRVSPLAGEDDALDERLPALKHAEGLARATTEAVGLLRGEGGAMDSVARAGAWLDKVTGIDRSLDALVEELTSAQALLDDASSGLRAYRDAIEHDPRVLDETMGRLGELAGLKRKYGPSLQEVLDRRQRAADALAASAEEGSAVTEAQQEVARTESLLRAAGERLTTARRDAVPGFVEALTAAAGDLAMDSARFDVSVEELPFASWTLDGGCRVEFLYSPAPSAALRPLARIASGGEISRVMLAMKGVLSRSDTVETLVFDEVDAGIGGATAHAVGRRLSELSRSHQVLVVTHLAQVAAYADAHLVVSKDVNDSGAATTVRGVKGEERVAEIARMLSGNASSTSLAHAQELLAESGRFTTAS